MVDSTLRHDHDVKRPLYARHGVPEFWLIDVRAKRLLVHRDPGDRDYAAATVRDVAEPIALPTPEAVRGDLSAPFPGHRDPGRAERIRQAIRRR